MTIDKTISKIINNLSSFFESQFDLSHNDRMNFQTSMPVPQGQVIKPIMGFITEKPLICTKGGIKVI